MNGTFSSGRTVAQRRILRTVRALTPAAVAASIIAVPACTQDAPAAEQERPNVVFIMVDDMRHDDLAAMPNTRRLLGGDNGARYNQAYTSTPLCCPSRATLLTGQHSHNNGVYGNAGPNGGVDALDDSNTLPVWLQQSGYNTGFFGKYLNGYGDPTDGVANTYVPPGWDTWQATSEPTVSNYTDFDVSTGSSTPNASGTATVEHITDGYQTGNMTGRATRHLRETLPTDDPAFVWLSYYAPHGGHGDYPQRYVPVPDRYAGQSRAGLPSSLAMDEADVDDKPAWVEGLPRLSEQDEADILIWRRERRDALHAVDDDIAEVVSTLRDAGELGDTVIALMSDNGYMQGEHRIWKEKTVPYLEASRVPLLIRGPGFTPGLHDEPVSNIDLAPTFADLAGVTPGLPVDGMSLLDPVPADRPILVEYLGNVTTNSWPWVRTYSSVIQTGMQYTEYVAGGRELYDLAADPWQRHNRIAAPTMRSSRQGLVDVLDEMRGCVGEGCR